MSLLDRLRRRRRRRLPAEARPALSADERIVAWAGVDGEADDGALVATNHGLWLPGRDERLGWHEIHKATWSGRVLTVIPGEPAAPSQDGESEPAVPVVDGEPVAYQLLEPGQLPHQVRVRVTRSVAYSTEHPVPGGAVRVVARRVTGRDGLQWALRYEGAVNRDDPQVQRLAAELVEQARSVTGA